jgi:hypothetical protein
MRLPWQGTIECIHPKTYVVLTCPVLKALCSGILCLGALIKVGCVFREGLVRSKQCITEIKLRGSLQYH